MCNHNRKIGDNYGMSCQDCEEQLSGYGFFGRNKTCIHFFIKASPDEQQKICMYCEMPEEIDGLTANDRNTFADYVEDALMHEHPANVAQRVEKELDAKLPYPLVFRGEADEFIPYRPASLNAEETLPF